jgi:hypothetical protein
MHKTKQISLGLKGPCQQISGDWPIQGCFLGCGTNSTHPLISSKTSLHYHHYHHHHHYHNPTGTTETNTVYSLIFAKELTTIYQMCKID